MSGATSSPTRADPRTRIQAMADELSASCDGCPVAIMVRETDVDALRLAAHVGVGPQVRSRLGPAFLESSAVGQAVDAASAGTQVRLQGALFDWLAVPLAPATEEGPHAGLVLLPWRNDPDVRAQVVERCQALAPRLHAVREEVRDRRLEATARSTAELERRWASAELAQGGPPISGAVGPRARPLEAPAWLRKAWHPVQLLDGTRDPRPLVLLVHDGAQRRSGVDGLVRAAEAAGLGLVTLLPTQDVRAEHDWRVDAVVAGGARFRAGLRAQGDPAWASDGQDLVLRLEAGHEGRRVWVQVLPSDLLSDGLRQDRLVHHLTVTGPGRVVQLPASLERLGEGGPAAQPAAEARNTQRLT